MALTVQDPYGGSSADDAPLVSINVGGKIVAGQVQGDPARTAEVGKLTGQTDAAFGTLADQYGKGIATFDSRK